jgi:hypothetical protein
MEIIITDVTIVGAENCVAGWCPSQNRMVRPLPSSGEFWETRLAGPHLFELGNIVKFNPAPGLPPRRGLPHSKEDTITQELPQKIGTIPPADLPGVLNPSLSSTIEAIFSGKLIRNYVNEGSDCASLGAIDISTNSLRFNEVVVEKNNRIVRRLECTLDDPGSQPKTFKVSSKQLRELHTSDGYDAVLALIRGFSRAHVRIGLAGPYDQQQNRCYAMVNNILFY